MKGGDVISADCAEEIDVNLTDAIEGIAPGAFRNLYIKGDTIRLPSKMNIWYTNSFLIKKEGNVIYIPKNISVIDNDEDEYGASSQINSSKRIHFLWKVLFRQSITNIIIQKWNLVGVLYMSRMVLSQIMRRKILERGYHYRGNTGNWHFYK